MGNGRSGPVQELKPPELRGNGQSPDDIRDDAAVLIDEQVSNRGEVECVSTERNLLCREKPTPSDSNTTCLRSSGPDFSDTKGHVWQEIASMYQQIVDRDNGLLPSSTPRSTILMYRSPVLLNGESVDETNCVNADQPMSSDANAKYVDSSTSTAEDHQLPREYYSVIQGVKPTNQEDHMSTHDVEMIETDNGNDCPRIVESFSLSESHCHFLPGQHIQKEDEYSGGASCVGNVHGLVYPAQVQDVWTPFKGMMKTKADTFSSEKNQSQINQDQHIFKIDPSEPTSCCPGESQHIDTGDLNEERSPLHIKATAWNEGGTNSDVCRMVQGHCLQPEHINQTEPLENICSFGVEKSEASVSERNHYNETEEFRPSAAGPFTVKKGPMIEEELPSFSDKNMIFGINCESNGSEITLKYGGTEEKGTQYLVEDTGLCSVPASKPCAWMKNIGATEECAIHTRSDHGGFLRLSNAYISSDLSASKENSATGLIQKNTVEYSGEIVAENSTHEISTHVQASRNGFAVECSPNPEPEENALSGLLVHSSAAKGQSENIHPRENKISQLKRLLEKQEEQLEKVRSQRRWETESSAATYNQEEVMNYVEEDLKDLNDDTSVYGQSSSSGRLETKQKKPSCPRKKIRKNVSDRRETLAQTIRTEMVKQNRKAGKRKGECFAYLDSAGVVVFGRKAIKKKTAVSSSRLENLIFKLRKSLRKEKGVLKKRSRSKFLAQRHKCPPGKAPKSTKEASPEYRSAQKQIATCKNSPHVASKNTMLEACEASNPSTNEEKKGEVQPSCSMACTTGVNAAFKDDMLKHNQDEFLGSFGLCRKTLAFVTGRFSALYGGPRRRFLDHEIQPTDCRGIRLGPDFEYRDEQGWFINETII